MPWGLSCRLGSGDVEEGRLSLCLYCQFLNFIKNFYYNSIYWNTYTLVYNKYTNMNSQFDLVGTIWKCPRCEEEIVITKDGVTHSCPGYWIKIRLDQLYEIRREFDNMKRKVFYGK
jgi:hypothetical protein